MKAVEPLKSFQEQQQPPPPQPPQAPPPAWPWPRSRRTDRECGPAAAVARRRRGSAVPAAGPRGARASRGAALPQAAGPVPGPRAGPRPPRAGTASRDRTGRPRLAQRATVGKELAALCLQETGCLVSSTWQSPDRVPRGVPRGLLRATSLPSPRRRSGRRAGDICEGAEWEPERCRVSLTSGL